MTSQIPAWTWAVPLFTALIALAGVLIGVIIQLRSLKRQLRSTHTLKMAELRVAWINGLRDAMAQYQSYGVTPNFDHQERREYYELGTKIELFMDPQDQDYKELQYCMYAFLTARTMEEKYAANAPYVVVCQRILTNKWREIEGVVARV